MINNLEIKNFKALKDENIEFRNLTVLCGENSSGKSTAILACLMLPCEYNNQERRQYVSDRTKGVFDISSFNIKYKTDVYESYLMAFSENDYAIYLNDKRKGNEVGIAYRFLCADRVAPQSLYNTSTSDNDIGIHGEYAAYILDRDKHKPIESALTADTSVTNLGNQVRCWLQHILQTDAKTEKVGDKIVLTFKNGNDEEFYSPQNTGFGTSLLLPIIVACLTAKIGETVIIENPEIHLHPKAQASIADFFAFIAHNGVQLILETHCEHLIKKLCYNVKDNKLKTDEIIFHYKERNKSFYPIYVNAKGQFADKDGTRTGFPSGFFDSTLKESLSIYR